jgi:outer membrane protein assembly factor BamB
VSAVLIDLGEMARERPAGQPEPAPVWLPVHRRLFGVLVAVVLVAVSATVPVPPPLVTVDLPTDDRDILLYGRDVQYAFGLGDGPGDRTVTAYRLPDGKRLWRARVPQGRVGWLTVPDPGTIELISEESPPPDGEPAAVAGGTGRVQYRAGAQLLGLLPAGDVLLWTSRGGEFTVEAGGRRLVARDPDTGRVRWSYAAPPGAWLSWDPHEGGLGTVAVMLPSGRIELRDLERGVLTATADAQQPRHPAEPPGSVQITGDLVLVEGWQAGRVWVTAYGRHRLDRRWTISMDLASEYVAPCGDQLCVGGLNGGIRTLDPATGATRWSSRRWSFVEPVGDYLLAGPAGARPNGTGLVVLDPRTGAVRADLGVWTPVWPMPAHGQPIAVRYDLRTSRVWFGRIDAERGRVFVVGTATGVTDDCRATEDYVACRRPNGRVGVWHLPPT